MKKFFKDKHVNIPPADGRCECCGKCSEELQSSVILMRPIEELCEDTFINETVICWRCRECVDQKIYPKKPQDPPPMKKFVQRNGTIITLYVDSEEDLKLTPGLKYIDPPPEDGRCECCGRHLSEVKPYEDGALLVMNVRNPIPDYGAFQFYSNTPLEAYGPPPECETVFNIISIENSSASITSWECRDCVNLEEPEYSKKMEGRSNLRRDSYNMVWLETKEDNVIARISRKLFIFVDETGSVAKITEHVFKADLERILLGRWIDPLTKHKARPQAVLGESKIKELFIGLLAAAKWLNTE